MVSEVKWTTFEMANQNTQHVQGLKMDWTEDAGLHQQFKDWREEMLTLRWSLSVYGQEKRPGHTSAQ